MFNMLCAVCKSNHKELLKTAYGLYLCEDCWDEYICSDFGRLEYLIGIYNKDYPVEEFDAEFLGEVVKSWKRYSRATALTPQQIFAIELKAIELGIF